MGIDAVLSWSNFKPGRFCYYMANHELPSKARSIRPCLPVDMNAAVHSKNGFDKTHRGSYLNDEVFSALSHIHLPAAIILWRHISASCNTL